MKVIVQPSRLVGTAKVPPSKSLTQRAIAAGLLSQGTTVILNPSFCNDALAAIRIAESLGASVTRNRDTVILKSGVRPGSAVTLHCGESGLAMRMFAPIAALLSREATFTGEGSLTKRPVTMIKDALEQMGVTVDDTGGHLPFTLKGELSPGKVTIDGTSGSQLLTGLLMTLPMLHTGSVVNVNNLKSRPYIDMTLKLLSEFGIIVENNDYVRFTVKGNQAYNAHEYMVEGDWSGAAFLLVAGAVSGEIFVDNLNLDSLQADRAVMNVLRMAGAGLKTEANKIKLSKTDLLPFTFDATDSPDLFPPLAALAAYCNGTSRIAGVGRLEHKESNRAEAIIDVLGTLNIPARVEGDELLVEGGEVWGGAVDSHNDHRIAMMAAVMALGGRGAVTINGAESVNKSFPGFFDTLRSCGAMIR
jgi:3-phosphoshikimate 1-carboxyvinyltransferase